MPIDYTDPHHASNTPKRPFWRSLGRGARLTCPKCGTGKLFSGFTTVNDTCPHCGAALHHQRADDFPPYIVIFIVGHIVVPLMLIVERGWTPELWVHAALWVPLTIVASILLLPPVKGAIVGWQWAAYMHGFDPDGDPFETPLAHPSHELNTPGRGQS